MFQPQDYLIASKLFLQLLGVIYFCAFGAFIFQMRGLIGENGILPVKRFLSFVKAHEGKKSFYYVPSVFWIDCRDRTLIGVIVAGMILSLLLIFNVYPPIVIFLLYVLYLSIVSVGQDFFYFGWEMFLLEITINAFFLSLTSVPNIMIWINLNLLLFRFHFQGGAVKLMSGDPNWRNLTALSYHYQTQPLPNTQAWYAHKLPMWFQKFSSAFMFIIELFVPFAIFVDSPEIRFLAFIFFVGLQVGIWFTGNFSYLNYLTVVLSIILVSDGLLGVFFDRPLATQAPLLLNWSLYFIGGLLILLQLLNLWNHLIRENPTLTKIFHFLQPFHVVNRYGIFAIMTTKRIEIVIEGSDDGESWKEYLFFYKPSEVERRPRRISPYQPRIDWQIWFLPFSNYSSESWFQNFLYHLLIGTPEVVNLLRFNPFAHSPPKYVRALAYEYVFSDRLSKKNLGHWWKRTFLRHYSPTMSLKKTTHEDLHD